MKKILLFMITAIIGVFMFGCGKQDSKNIVVWVGEESSKFYQDICSEYLNDHPNFGFTIEVKGIDTGTVAGVITQDPQAAADIFTVAHDNIGKLVSGGMAKPIMDQGLIDQILADNPDSFKKVIYSTLNDQEFLFAAPYISQALFLYYNKQFVTNEQAKTFEGLVEAAKASGTKAFTVTGDDGYNHSYTLLATKLEDHSTTVKIYEGATADKKTKGECNVQGDDTVALIRWEQRIANNENGFKWASPDGWDADLRNNGCLAVIGGAWHYNTAAAAVGETNLGLALIPTMTLTEEDCQGLTGVKAGDVYRGGTFADCKCFMINANSSANKYSAIQQLIKFLSSQEVQNKSFKMANNVPAYTAASEYIKSLYEANEITENQYLLASVQTEMAAWGIPQPFITGILNTYFYSKNAPGVFRAIVDQDKYPSTGDTILEDTTSLEGIRKSLYMIEYIWLHGQNPTEFPSQYPTSAK